jgi:hypothetical protein
MRRKEKSGEGMSGKKMGRAVMGRGGDRRETVARQNYGEAGSDCEEEAGRPGVVGADEVVGQRRDVRRQPAALEPVSAAGERVLLSDENTLQARLCRIESGIRSQLGRIQGGQVPVREKKLVHGVVGKIVLCRFAPLQNRAHVFLASGPS